MSSRTFLVVGASRGIGAAVAKHLAARGDRVIGVSRSKPELGDWIMADVSQPEGIRVVIDSVGDQPLDGLLFLGGVWERHAFTPDFDFAKSSDQETRFVLSVNLVAPIELTRGIAKCLFLAENPRAIYIGSLSGLDHSATPEVANTASKFGLRGAVQSLRQAYKCEKLGFTVINPGNIDTDEVTADIQAGLIPAQRPIPMADLCATIDWILSLSTGVDVSEVNLMQTAT